MAQQKSASDGLGDVRYEIRASGWMVHDMPTGIRPREEAERVGIGNVADDVLLALILRTGTKGCSVVDLARGLLARYGNLTNLAAAPEEELARFKGVGKIKAQILKASLELGMRLSSERVTRRQVIRMPTDVLKVLAPRARLQETEVFWTLLLDTKNRLQSKPVEVSAGLLNSSLVHPREVFRDAIRSACAAVILAHNHPSGDPTPSSEDINVTKQLVAAGKIIDIKVLDHVVIGALDESGAERFVSIREAGLVDFS